MRRAPASSIFVMITSGLALGHPANNKALPELADARISASTRDAIGNNDRQFAAMVDALDEIGLNLYPIQTSSRVVGGIQKLWAEKFRVSTQSFAFDIATSNSVTRTSAACIREIPPVGRFRAEQNGGLGGRGGGGGPPTVRRVASSSHPSGAPEASRSTV